MSKVDLLDKNWVELVFEGKNKEYGAYALLNEGVGEAGVKGGLNGGLPLAELRIDKGNIAAAQNELEQKQGAYSGSKDGKKAGKALFAQGGEHQHAGHHQQQGQYEGSAPEPFVFQKGHREHLLL